MGASETGSDVTGRLSYHGFLFVFQQRFPSILYRFEVISGFPIAENDEKTISAAKGVQDRN
jgi:hypothetical protein